MSRRFVLGTLSLILASGLYIPTAASGQPVGATKEQSLAPMLARVIPGVVSVRVTGASYPILTVKSPRGNQIGEAISEAEKEPFRTGGSGVIIDAAAGIIVTNHHVIADAVGINVGLDDGRNFPAQLIGVNVGTDVAVLKIKAEKLVAVPLGNSDRVRVGDYIVAVGNPYGLERSASAGIVSALLRSDLGHGLFEDFIQIDAAVNPGNSGGALVNMRGQLVGINTATGVAKSRPYGIGFAVPINMARSVAAQLIATGKVRYGGLGILAEPIAADTLKNLQQFVVQGAAVGRVIPGSPAEKAGVESGDVVTSVFGKPVRSPNDYSSRVVTHPVGSSVPIEIVSKKGARKLVLVTSELSANPPPMTVPARINGLGGAALKPILIGSEHFGVLEGVEIADVVSGSPADLIGLRRGDVISRIAESRVRTLEEVGTVMINFARSREQTLSFEMVRAGVKVKVEVPAG